MSENSAVEYVQPTKKWQDYDKKSLLVSLIRNSNKTDCRFAILDSQGNAANPEKILKSFQWILTDISPYWRRYFLNREVSKHIPVVDRNFELILAYAHTKILCSQSFKQQLSLYESARKYEIEPLMDEILSSIEVSLQNHHEYTDRWMTFFKLAYDEKKTDRRLFYVFDKLLQSMSADDMEKTFENNMEMTLTFDEELFYDFLSFLKVKKFKPSLCFKATENYLIQKVFRDYSMKDENIRNDVIILFMENIDFPNMDLKRIENSKLLVDPLNVVDRIIKML